MKKLYKILIAVLVVLSVCGNIYYFGSQFYKEKRLEIYNQGVNDTGVYIFNTVKQNGEINIRNGEENLTLIQKQ